MEMGVIHIGLLILILAAFVIAYFSARTWHWGYVVVVLGIFLSTLGFFVLSAEVLRINAVLRKEVNRLEDELVRVEAQNVVLVKGTSDTGIINELRNAEVRIPNEDAESIPSLAHLEHELLLATRNRGRVWWNVMPTGIDQSGAIQIGVERPVPAGINADSVVVLFEAGEPQLPDADGRPSGPQYLGQFRVTQASGQTATLQPTLPMDEYERRRLAESRGPWIMYDTMPADRHDVFAGMSDQQLREKLPPGSVEEYIRHGKEPGPDDDEFRQAGFDEAGKRLPPDQLAQAAKKQYQRRLRDYALEFDELSRRRVGLMVSIEAGQKDLERLQTALAAANELKAFREDEIGKLNTDLAGVTKEREAIERHLAQVKQQLARGQKLLAEALQRNSELENQLAARHRAATSSTLPATAVPAGPLALGVN
jgi:hypothetical protein